MLNSDVGSLIYSFTACVEIYIVYTNDELMHQ